MSKTEFTMPFGKYRGQVMEDLPENYLNWLLNPKLNNGKTLRIEYKVVDAARREIARRRTHETKLQQRSQELAQAVADVNPDTPILPATKNYKGPLAERYAGAPDTGMDYILEIENHMEQTSQLEGPYKNPNQALAACKKDYHYPSSKFARYTVWEILPTGHKKVIWCSWGQIYNKDNKHHSLNQGNYPGDTFPANKYHHETN